METKVFGPSVKVTGWADLVSCVSPALVGLAWLMLHILGGDDAPASGTGFTWPLKSCSVWANIPTSSSPDLQFCFKFHTPVPGIACTAKALGLTQKKYLCRASGETSVSLPLGNKGYPYEAEVTQDHNPDISALCTWSNGPCCLTGFG